MITAGSVQRKDLCVGFNEVGNGGRMSVMLFFP